MHRIGVFFYGVFAYRRSVPMLLPRLRVDQPMATKLARPEVA